MKTQDWLNSQDKTDKDSVVRHSVTSYTDANGNALSETEVEALKKELGQEEMTIESGKFTSFEWSSEDGTMSKEDAEKMLREQLGNHISEDMLQTMVSQMAGEKVQIDSFFGDTPVKSETENTFSQSHRAHVSKPSSTKRKQKNKQPKAVNNTTSTIKNKLTFIFVILLLAGIAYQLDLFSL